MKKLNILQVSPFFYPAALATGPANVARAQSRELTRRGHAVSVYASDTCDRSSQLDIDKEANVDGVAVTYCHSLNHRLAADHRIILCPQLLQLARRHIATFDLVHLHDYRTFNNVIVATFAKKAGVPYVIQAHGTVPRLVEKRCLKGLFDLCFGRWMLRNAARLIALSQMEFGQYANMGMPRQQITVLPNGIESPPSGLLEAGALFRARHKIEPRDFAILFLGRIHKIKGLDLLVGAFGRLLDRLATAKLVIAGPDDRYLSTLKSTLCSLGLERHVILTGRLSDREKWPALGASDVLVLPSSYEAFPLSVLEAWAMKVPVVITPRNGLADWAEKGAGIVVPRNRDVLADALFELSMNPEKRGTLGETGKKLVEQHFTWEQVINTMEQMYYSVIDGRDNE
jgi:glycosyltransferase involved in cell wall biosynthesis